MWNNEWKKGKDYPEWGDTEVYKKTIAGVLLGVLYPANTIPQYLMLIMINVFFLTIY